MTLPEIAGGGASWSSNGLARTEAMKCWEAFVSRTLATMRVEVPRGERFAANWRTQEVGPLKLVTLEATAQHVVHEDEKATGLDQRKIQLAYCKRGTMAAHVGGARFPVNEGEFVLLDNAQSYRMRMDDTHEVIDLIMPASWLEDWLPQPFQLFGRPYSASTGWGLPLGSFLSTMAREIHEAALPRSVIADQVGTLLALAVDYRPPVATRHKAMLAQRAQRMIRERYSDPELDPDEVAKAVGISKRYLHAVLAEAGMTFIGMLTRARLDPVRSALRPAADRRNLLALRLPRPELFRPCLPPPLRGGPARVAQRIAVVSLRRSAQHMTRSPSWRRT